MKPHRLVVSCPDQPGIVSAVSSFLYDQGANIVSSHQYSSDPSGGRFFLRMEFFLEEEPLAENRAYFEGHFDSEVAAYFGMERRIRWSNERQKIMILVSKHDHCLTELLWRSKRGELDAHIAAVVSNHHNSESDVHAAGISFYHVTADDKDWSEQKIIELTRRLDIDLLVLARYMQILSGNCLSRIAAPAINIHHSFLPAFAGAKPYQQAKDKGVKLIGATAHYVTETLDDGPIIEQDIVRVDHNQATQDLERVGRDIERLVLARAVSLHLDDRVFVNGGSTVVF